jgi:hypothetical protein
MPRLPNGYNFRQRNQLNSSQCPDMDPEALIASYEAREPRYTEGDFLRRFAEIKKARAIGISGASADKAPEDWMIALLASGRISDAEYFRLTRLLGVDSTGLIYSEPPVARSLAEQLRADWRAFVQILIRLRRE